MGRGVLGYTRSMPVHAQAPAPCLHLTVLWWYSRLTTS